MKTKPPPPASRWVLHVHTHLGCSGTLVYDFGGGIRCQLSIPPSKVALLLALIASRAIDIADGKTEMVGNRSLSQLGKLIGVMPGNGNSVAENTLGGTKRALIKRVELELLKLRLQTGRKLEVILPVLHLKYGDGYCLPLGGIALVGLSLDSLMREVRAKLSK